MSFTAPMSGRRKLLVIAVGIGLILFGAASLWQNKESDPRFARVLVLDARTGKTLHEGTLDAPSAVVTFLANGRVAVATLKHCSQRDVCARISVLDAALKRVIRTREVDPYIVQRLDARLLHMRFEPGAWSDPPKEDGHTTTYPLGSGTLVLSGPAEDMLGRRTNIAAYDAAGHRLWRRHLGAMGGADFHAGRLVLAVMGDHDESLAE
jgi:hypothetical protein